MNIDNSSLVQLGIFNPDRKDESLFAYLDFTISNGGHDKLAQRFYTPLKSKSEIESSYALLQLLHNYSTDWNGPINNGVAFMVEKYLDSGLSFDTPGTLMDTITIPIYYKQDYQKVRYSIEKVCDFVRGMHQIFKFWSDKPSPREWEDIINSIENQFAQNPIYSEMIVTDKLTSRKVLRFDYYLKQGQNKGLEVLLDNFYSMDMWYSLSAIQDLEGYHYPQITEERELYIQDFFHPMLEGAVAYSIDFSQNNFLFLTGANMAGKSTFIRAIGTVVYLAHLGIPVPASHMRFGYFDGLSCSITVTDNLMEGESFFYNEVQRINEIIQKIESKDRWLVLMDELFKGTNYKDALQCTESIVRGLLKYDISYFVLTTHLYQLAHDLEGTPGVMFKYFETTYDADDHYHFTYKLKDGVSEDTIGYKILRNSGVLKRLDDI